MKIALINHAYPPMVSGTAVIVHRLANGLVQRGHQVLVICASDRREPYSEETARLTIHRLRSYPNPFRAAQRLLIWSRSEYDAALQAFAPDVIHVHEPFVLAMLAVEYGKRAGCPVVFTFHAFPEIGSVHVPKIFGFQALVNKMYWRYVSRLMRRVDATTTTTASAARLILEHTGIMPIVISGGVDLLTFKPGRLTPDLDSDIRARYGIPASTPIILNVGRLDKEKQVDKVIRSAAGLLRGLPAHLLIVGDGREKPSLEALSRKLGVQDRVRFTAYVEDHSELADLYRLAEVFVTASEVETQGLVLLEAAACGLPLIAPPTPVMAEIIQEGVNGFLIPIGEDQTMSTRLEQILSDSALAARMGQSSVTLARDHSLEKTLEAYERFYLETVSHIQA
jgi:1,2-diacylglycerol 3-alpha-glucosyltransferase